MRPSCSRLPVRNDGRKSRASSTSRISATLGLETPAYSRSRSTASRLAVTPQSVTGSVRNRSGDRGRTKKKDPRPIQDKKWQTKMILMTQNYFQTYPEGVEILNKGVSLRPITLNMFVHLTNLVLQNIDPRHEILTLANYVETLPNILNVLMYPGNVTASMLKSANTMHSWPHILAILSWLVELHQRLSTTQIDDMIFAIPDNVPLDEQIRKTEIKTLSDFFVLWNRGGDQENQEEILEDIYRKLYKYPKGLEDELIATVDKQSEELKQIQRDNEAEDEEIQELETKFMLLKTEEKEIKDVTKQHETYAKKTRNEISQLKTNRDKLLEQISRVRETNAHLQETVATQPMSVQQRDEQLKVIADLKSQNAMYEEKQKLQQEIADKMDLELSQIKREIEQKVQEFNMKLMSPALEYPELKDLALRQDRLLHESMFQHLAEKTAVKQKLTEKTEEKLAKVRAELADTNGKRRKQDVKLEESAKYLEKVQLEYDEVNGQYEAAVKLHEKATKQMTDEILDLKQKIADVKNKTPDFNGQFDTLRNLIAKHDELKNQYESKERDMLVFFNGLYKDIKVNQIPKSRQLRKAVLNKVTEKCEKLAKKPEKKIVL